MSITPTIFNEKKVPHTIIGGTTRKTDETADELTVILLNRGGRYYRSAVFQNLENAGFTSVISIELSSEPYDIESLSVRFPAVKFLVPLQAVTVGEMINTGMAETGSSRVFVVWNDMRVTASGTPRRLIEKIRDDDRLCTAPLLNSPRMESLPVQMVPALNGKHFQVEPMSCIRDGSPTIYPFDFTGIYNREKFIRLGGYDHTIRNPYWQNLDFGFRAHLWGELIELATSFRLSYEEDVPREDITTDISYMKFFLKNLAPVHRNDEAYLPLSRFFSYLHRSGAGLSNALADFRAVRAWVRTNRFRFTGSAPSLVRTWEPCL